ARRDGDPPRRAARGDRAGLFRRAYLPRDCRYQGHRGRDRQREAAAWARQAAQQPASDRCRAGLRRHGAVSEQMSHELVDELAAAFALGALDADEARAVAEHLTSCQEPPKEARAALGASMAP